MTSRREFLSYTGAGALAASLAHTKTAMSVETALASAATASQSKNNQPYLPLPNTEWLETSIQNEKWHKGISFSCGRS